MKQLTWKLIIPLTVISFVIFTKWWYALPVDAPDTIFTGFPLPYVCEGWHTSLSLQFFLTELVIDLLTYFTFWFVLIVCIDRFLITIKIQKIFTTILLTLTGLITAASILLVSNPDNIFYIKRYFEMNVMVTGYKFIWEDQTSPDLDQYDSRSNKE